MLSTQDLSLLPDVDRLRTLSQSLAMLDAILCPDWQYRYYSFTAHWATDTAMASMRNGSGDEYFLLFTPAGAIMKGFVHEASLSPYAHDPPHLWPGILDAVPAIFADFLTEPAFKLADTTFCIWRTFSDTTWQRGPVQYPADPDPDGAARLLAILDGNPQTYQVYAEEYYERPVSLQAITHLYAHHPLTPEIVAELNNDLALEDLQQDLDEIEYPV
jgi:hypothetical protein